MLKHQRQHRMSKVLLKKWLPRKKKEEVDKDQRESNLFIYRARESNKENSEERQNENKQFFDALCNDILGIGLVKTKNIIRLGKKNDQDDEQKPPRPLKIVLEDTIYRNKILQKNCDKLREAEDLFKNISMSPDYSKDEPEIIGALVTEAKKKTEEYLNFVYRVRGPSKILQLKTFAKRWLQPNLQKAQDKTHQKITKKWKKPNWKENVTNPNSFFHVVYKRRHAT